MINYSFIIPTYNSAEYLKQCLDSINNQTTTNPINIIIVDDKSSDNTLEIANNYVFKANIKLEILENEINKKQGYSRNLALSKINSDYVMFLDSDDFIAKDTLHRVDALLAKKKYDILFIDWLYYDDINKKYHYTMTDSLLATNELVNEECADILSFNVYFTTPAFYNVQYLHKHNIKYGEGYIYEDYEFQVLNAMNAHSIYLLHYPLYSVRINEKSTTKTNYDSKMHYHSFIEAVSSSLKKLYNRNEYSIYYFYNYALKKLYSYANTRIPRKYRSKMISETIAILNTNKDYPLPDKMSNFNNFVFKNRLIDKKKTHLISYKKFRMKLGLKKRKLKSKLKPKPKNNYKNEIISGKIVMTGFDLEYRGNSKYLYDYLKTIDGSNVVFLKNDEDYYYHLNTAEFIIFESWNNLKYHKKPQQKYIQLWHGTPLKRIVFSSDEPILLARNPKGRRNKFKDYQQWDYFVVDNPSDKTLFDDCFPYHNFTYLESGYPRVKYLVDNQANVSLKEALKAKYGINKPLILYAPTWRDEQLISKDKDWLLDIDYLIKKYPEYQFYNVEHSYLSDQKRTDDIQELILISDIIISDYSSIIFDGVTLNKRIILYQNDFTQFQEYRGVYEDKLKPFKNNITHTLDELELLLNDTSLIPDVVIENNTNYAKTFEKLLEIVNS